MGARPLAGLLEPRDDAGAPTVIGAARIDPIYLT